MLVDQNSQGVSRGIGKSAAFFWRERENGPSSFRVEAEQKVGSPPLGRENNAFRNGEIPLPMLVKGRKYGLDGERERNRVARNAGKGGVPRKGCKMSGVKREEEGGPTGGSKCKKNGREDRLLVSLIRESTGNLEWVVGLRWILEEESPAFYNTVRGTRKRKSVHFAINKK